jgi:hypothetical protein
MEKGIMPPFSVIIPMTMELMMIVLRQDIPLESYMADNDLAVGRIVGIFIYIRPIGKTC